MPNDPISNNLLIGRKAPETTGNKENPYRHKSSEKKIRKLNDRGSASELKRNTISHQKTDKQGEAATKNVSALQDFRTKERRPSG
jgi:hypothetical protein